MMLWNLLNPRSLRIGCFDFDDEEMGWERPRLRRLLGAIVYQAMNDGMLKIRIGVDRASGEPWMKYFGPLDDAPDKQISWDMVPPDACWYPRMLQVCLSLAELDQGLPIEGMIPAIKQRKRLRLKFTIDTIDSFQIAWDADYAFDLAQSKTT
ncbi:hypothetical protein JYU10_00660 [bacterium AH-315-J04]|nr:hypothetical protein [bacterium AH-315-J04]